jgi:hypothetical protein
VVEPLDDPHHILTKPLDYRELLTRLVAALGVSSRS